MKRREFMTLIGGAMVGGAAVGAAAWPLVAGAQQPSGGLDDRLRKSIGDKDLPGIVAMATDRQRVLYQGAFGMADIATGRALTADALFRIASMTKAITSTAAMQLVEQGRFGLDDPVEKYLPAFARLQVFESFDGATGAYRLRPATRIVTVRHLMTHTSGLGYGFTSTTVRDFKPRAGEEYPVGPLVFEPGERWLYGTSTDWLGKLVEAVSGRPLDEYFRRRILEPLGMADTFYNVPADKQARLVATHHRRADGTIVKEPTQPAPFINPIIGGGGLSSTAGDYIRFVRMILNDGQLDGVRILKADTVEAMSRNQIGAIGVPALKTALPERSDDFSFVADGRDKWGLGFLITVDGVAGKRSAGSLSWGGIYNTYFWIDRTRGVAGVIMTQFLPFADRKALAMYDTFERGVYEIASATR
jgi:CubicO group peptidase (beta-lactamase class C family)